METVFIYGITFLFFIYSFIKDRAKTRAAAVKGLMAFSGILPQLITVIIAITIALAIFDAETISRFIGKDSGLPGLFGAVAVGSITLIPGFIAFPAAGELLRNGAGTLQIAAFVSSLMMVGIITLPLEIKYFGKRAAITRNALALLFSFGSAYFVAWMVSL